MTERPDLQVTLRPWAPGDLPLLERLLGDPEMTRFVGGPESSKKLRDRHQRYLDFQAPGGTFAIAIEPDGAGVGWVGYWPSEVHEVQVWEVGWSVLPDYQGRGIATAAMKLALDSARRERLHRFADAYPSVDNGPSNRVCEKLGFELLGEVDVEYPPGHAMHANHWRLDLTEEPDGEASAQ